MQGRHHTRALKGLDLANDFQTIALMPDTSPILTIDEGLQVEPPGLAAPFLLSVPQGDSLPVVFASPHSGNLYPSSMVSALCVPLMDVRRTEDAFVDELFASAPARGAALLAARYGRSVVDLNREGSCYVLRKENGEYTIAGGAVAADDGVIVFAGTTSECLARVTPGPGATVLDGRGCTVVPGFADPHTPAVYAGDGRDEPPPRLRRPPV